MDEQPDNSNWFDIQPSQTDPPQDNRHQDSLEKELIQFTNDVTTIDDNTTPEPGLENLNPESPSETHYPQI